MSFNLKHAKKVFNDLVSNESKTLDNMSSVSSKTVKDKIPEDQINVTVEFKENVIKYVTLDDQVREKKKEIRELEKQKKPLEEAILKNLDDLDEQVIEIGNGKLRKNKSETKVPLNQDIIKDAIRDKVENPQVVKEILEMMEQMRPKKERVNLKRTYARGKKINKKKENLDKS